MGFASGSPSIAHFNIVWSSDTEYKSFEGVQPTEHTTPVSTQIFSTTITYMSTAPHRTAHMLASAHQSFELPYIVLVLLACMCLLLCVVMVRSLTLVSWCLIDFETHHNAQMMRMRMRMGMRKRRRRMRKEERTEQQQWAGDGPTDGCQKGRDETKQNTTVQIVVEGTELQSDEKQHLRVYETKIPCITTMRWNRTFDASWCS